MTTRGSELIIMYTVIFVRQGGGGDAFIFTQFLDFFPPENHRDCAGYVMIDEFLPRCFQSRDYKSEYNKMV